VGETCWADDVGLPQTRQLSLSGSEGWKRLTNEGVVGSNYPRVSLSEANCTFRAFELVRNDKLGRGEEVVLHCVVYNRSNLSPHPPISNTPPF
jgi:hypothetical protein